MPRVKLSEQYQNEREEICNKLIEIVGNEFILCELDNNLEKQTAILALKDQIQKYFAVSSITAFKPSVSDVKRDYLNIVRGILRQQGYIFLGTNFVSKENYQKTIKYNIFKKQI
jgi:hypothetical protein